MFKKRKKIFQDKILDRRNRKKRLAKIADDEYQMIKPNLSPQAKRLIAVIILFGLAILSILSFFNMAGIFGEYLKKGLILGFGWNAFIFPWILILLGYLLIAHKRKNLGPVHYIGFVFLILSYSGLLHLFVLDQGREIISQGQGGGYLGYAISYPLNQIMGVWASFVVLALIFLISLLILFESWLVRFKEDNFWQVKDFFSRLKYRSSESDDEEIQPLESPKAEQGAAAQAEESMEQLETAESDHLKKIVQPELNVSKKPKIKIDLPLHLLNGISSKPTSGAIEENKTIIKKTLENFGILVEMGEVSVGPTVTQYTLRPAEGVKISKIITLQNDLALALAAHPLRIEAPIPGKSLVGIEVPNQVVATVTLREILDTREFRERKSNLNIALGKDVAGQPWLANLSRMPHLLVAGATGSGKTVCLNTIIISLLFQNSSEDLKFILIDPKRVELTVYNNIPHLLTPVITDVPKTLKALKWAVAEMERRFHVLSEAGKRDIEAYNNVCAEKMAYIILVIDELADLMAASAAEVEALIIRLAQMARAVGIHLVMATQRPSVNVITGLIKANITSRIAFSVASITDSRTILDTGGAEKLLGRGDMLYISAELSKPKRLQGAFLADKEVEAVARFLKERFEPEYNEEVVETSQPAGNFGGAYGIDASSPDELLEQAKETVVRAGKASASLLQRRLRIGYARAARLLDLLEEQGIIGPADGARPRDVLLIEDDGESAEMIGGEEDGEDEAEEDEDDEADS